VPRCCPALPACHVPPGSVNSRLVDPRPLLPPRFFGTAGWLLLAFLFSARTEAAVELADPESPAGYVALLLINEAPFPGERGWESEADSKDAMRQILLVLDARLKHTPRGYTQRQIASIKTDNIIDLMTAGGVHGQIDGFYRDDNGRPATVARVRSRLDYLLGIASKGKDDPKKRMVTITLLCEKEV